MPDTLRRLAGLAATIGRGAMSNPLVDMEKPDVIFCIGTNMTECHPVAATRLKKAIAKGAKLIVADPRRIGLAEMSDLYLPLRVGLGCGTSARNGARHRP